MTRLPEVPRDIRTSFDRLARVDGSCRFSFGPVCALASVSGPIEVRLAAENPSKATFEVLHRPLSNIPATHSKSIASLLRAALEPSLILTKTPRTLIQTVVQSLSDDKRDTETLNAAMINACSLALLNAGSVPMSGVVVAVSVGKLKDGSLVVDPEQEQDPTDVGCFAFIFSGPDVDCVWSSWRNKLGKMHSKDDILDARALAEKGATIVHDFIRRSLSDEEEEGDDKMEI